MSSTNTDVAIHFEAASREIAKAVSLCEFSLKERRILTVILEASFGIGRTEAFVPGLDYFARASRVSKGNASEILRHLKRCMVIVEEPKDYYAFRFPIEIWRVPLQIDMTVLHEVLDLRPDGDYLNAALRSVFVAKQQQQHLPTRGLDVAVRPERSKNPDRDAGQDTTGVVVSRESAGSVEAGGGEPVLVSGQGYPAPTHKASPVPGTGTSESGSRFGNPAPGTGTSESGSRFGNPAPGTGAKPQPVRSLSPVPVSGTVPSLQDCVLGTNQDCTKVPSTKLVRKTPLQPCTLGQSKLNLNQQTAFDEMEKLGFWKNDETSKWVWLKFVQKNPLPLVEELIGDVRFRLKHPSLPPLSNPGAFANKTLQRWKVSL